MAQIHTVRLVDDLTGNTADETVPFGPDGKQFEIDLSAANAKTLRDKLAPFLSAARRATTGDSGRPARSAPASSASSAQARKHNQAVRAWARDSGFDVSARGRIPAEVLIAYRAARPNDTSGSRSSAAVGFGAAGSGSNGPQPAEFSG